MMDRPDEQIQPSIFFDYDSLDQSHRLIVQQHTGEIRRRLRRSAQDVWEIGQRLADVRSRLKYGQFLAWLKAEFGWSQRTAYNFINVYETFGDRFANLATVDIATSVLYQLAAPSVPDELRDQILESAAEGEKITNKSLKAAIEEHKKPRQQAQSQTPPKSPSTKPEIITVIPKPVVDIEPDSNAQPLPTIAIAPSWYRLGSQHLIFCGDTASKVFVEAAPPAKLAVAATSQDWAHDWLVERVDSVVILPEEELTHAALEQLLKLLSSSGDRIIFPWLPLPEMIAIAHRADRTIYAGDPAVQRCQRAIASSGLKPEPISDHTVATLAG
ncbi:MAG: DUF3102 domain-containing protein [Synechococcales bacterium]|nr:DUF3102 domain-containing protein [Synechococcales bacterium]